ncbi:hypothetical protein V6N11_067949 [Hibiscus sabdariffa]|uniref:Uncharacterized protein n=1 Tax=Hibiscus sabdariffa TaxID=183260 RepID=A0ABR2SS95_9ROSI
MNDNNPTQNLGGNASIVPGSFGGRPPETLSILAELTPMKRHGSPILAENQPVTKKRRCNPDNMMVTEMGEEQRGEGFDINMGDFVEADADANVLMPNPIESMNQEVYVGINMKPSVLVRYSETGGTNRNTSKVANEPRHLKHTGSWFAILQEDHDFELEPANNEAGDNQQRLHTTQDNSRVKPNRGKKTIVISDVGDGCSEGVRGTHLRKENTTDMEMDEGDAGIADIEVNVLTRDGAREVASNAKVTSSETSLIREKHTVVRVGVEKLALTTKETVGWGTLALNRGGTKVQTKAPTALKGSQRQSSKIRKKDDRTQANPTLVSQVSAIVSDLDKVRYAEDTRPSNSHQ